MNEEKIKSYKFHFHPEKGWCNDPNGLIFCEGKYHLFYQYYPDDIVWGPMHWGHAVSTDLITWQEFSKPALCPDELGYIFSGSCILDTENVSGLGTKNKPAMLAFFTHHNPDNGEQQQSIAYSLDYENFTKYQGNPVIKNRFSDADFRVDFRDPKVVKNTVTGGYTMVLSGGKEIVFYHSEDLLNWEKSGEFNPGVQGFEGICECPDLLEYDTTEGKKWVLIISSILPPEKIGSCLRNRNYPTAKVMQYFVGDFDGMTFVSDSQAEPKILDYGPDNYAMVSFSNTDEKLLMGWGENWEYVAEVPAEVFRGKMTIPRICELKKKGDEYFLCFRPKFSAASRRINISEGEMIGLSSSLKISLLENELIVTRDKAGCLNISPVFENEGFISGRAGRKRQGKCQLQIIEDEHYFEIFADDGEIVFSVMDFGE